MRKTEIKDYFSFIAPRLYVFSAILGIIVRIVLLMSPLTVIESPTAMTWIRIFGLGFVNDMAFATLALLLPFLFYSFYSDKKYEKPWGYIIGGLLLALTIYVICFNDITDEYGGVVPGIADGLLAVLCISFLLKLFLPNIRKPWRRTVIFLSNVIFIFLLVLNTISESVFWSEFGVRYNFIAVDYLVYTNEVIGNIFESYPMVPILLGVTAVSLGIYALFTKGVSLRNAGIASGRRYLLTLVILGVGCFVSVKFLHWGYRNLMDKKSTFVTELQENGCWNFLEAYSSNELDYSQFYAAIPQEEAEAKVRELCGWNSDGIRKIDSEKEEVHKNIVLITIESLSADFFAAYGNTQGITPNMDSILSRSLAFDNLFATGNRTVRGLEAVTLCIPPSSGESIIKRPDNGGRFTTGEVLRSKGYSTTFIYGGDSYFDNMESFFGNNGYDIHDKKSFDASKISFDNVWGTCDEDSYAEALNLFDAKAQEGRPFFGHIMTISNHRPYTYPEGRIEYEGNPMSRAAAVKYTDYAIGDFLGKAATKEWFNNTVFIILADHCASSAGKTSLPLEGYHIPAMIYAPGFIEPQRVAKVCSQIDLMPTLFSILGFSYESRFYGDDILSEDFRERAFMATYQDLGYFTDGILTVLSPVRQIKQFQVTKDGFNYPETLMENLSEPQVKEAQSFYQISNGK